MSKSKKHSASTRKPLEPLTYFVDHCLGTVSIPACIFALGAKCETLSSHFIVDAPDAEWIPKVAERGWIILTADRSILKNPIERTALQNAGARYVGITCASQTTDDTVALLTKHFTVLDALMRVAPVPVLTRLMRSGPQVMIGGKWTTLRHKHGNSRFWRNI